MPIKLPHKIRTAVTMLVAVAVCMTLDVSCKKHQPSANTTTASSGPDSMMRQAYDCYKNADFTKSIELTREAMKHMPSNNKEAMSDAYSHLAACYQRIGMNDYALNNGFSGLNINEQLKDYERISSSYSNIAAIYLAAQRPNEAKNFIKKALEVEKKIKTPDSTKLSSRYSMAAEIYLKTNEADSALNYINKALAIDTTAHDTLHIAQRMSVLADVYSAKDSTQKALEHYLKAIKLHEEKGDRYHMMLTYKNLGSLYIKLGDKSNALKWLEKSTDIAKACNAKDVLKQNYLMLANIMSDSNPSKTAEYLSMSNSLADSLYNDATSKLTSYYAMEFQTKQKQHTIEEQQQSITIQRLIITAAIIAVALLMVVCIALFLINMLRARARKAEKNTEQMRERFFTNITHEFRTPLSVILGEAEDLRTKDNDADKQPKYNAIIDQSNHMLKLVNQLMSISKVRTSMSDLPWKNGDISLMVNMITENIIYSQSQDTTIELTTDNSDFNIDFVPEYCHSIISNLLYNAIKSASPNGVININMSRKKDTVKIDITDNGRCIKKEDLPRIFDLFYQGNDDNSDWEIGIGLALVKQMIEAMKGSINVKSKEGEGTTFSISIPAKHKNRDYPKWIPKMLAPTYDNKSDSQDEITPSHGNSTYISNDDKRIALVVDDNDAVATYISHVMQDSYNVVIAHNGQEGLEKAREVIPDIIISDLKMPELDGQEMCRRIRNDELMSHIPIIIVTVRDSDKDRLESLAAGADAYLTKPFKNDELMAIANNLLKNREMLRTKYQSQLGDGAETVPEEDKVPILPTGNISNMARKNEIFIEKVKSIILKNISKSEMNSALIADAMNLSQRQLNRKVKSVLGLDTASYIRQVRILKAQEMLLETDDPVSDIAYNCGFDSGSYFSKIFKQYTKHTPSDFRKLHEQQ